MSAVAGRRAARAGAGGFTLIEVMVSLLIFMVALLGLIALQRASIAGTNKGREHTGGVNVARYVLTQLQNEAATWPLAESVPAAEDFPMLALGLGNPGRWNLLPDGEGTVDGAFRLDAYLEHSGRDFYADVDSAPYCVHYMVEPMGPNQELLRVRVRVVWPKWGQYVITSEEDPGTWNDCAWPDYEDPGVTGDRVRYSDLVELSGIVTREFTGQMAQ